MLMCYEGSRLLPFEIQSINGGLSIAYDISGTQTLAHKYENQELNEEALRRLFVALWKCCEEMEEYLLPMEGILMKPEQIYWIPTKNQFRFCFYPGGLEGFRQSFISLTEFCMKHTEHQDAGAVMFIYGLYRILQDEHIENEELRRFLEEAGEEEEGKALKQDEFAAEAEPYEQRGIPTGATGAGDSRAYRERAEVGKGQLYLYTGMTVTAFAAVVIFALRYWVFCGYEADCKFMIFAAIAFAFFLYSTIQIMHRRRMAAEKKEDIGIPTELVVENKN